MLYNIKDHTKWVKCKNQHLLPKHMMMTKQHTVCLHQLFYTNSSTTFLISEDLLQNTIYSQLHVHILFHTNVLFPFLHSKASI